MSQRYVDRIDAGRRLAERLKQGEGKDAIVLGLARGGVVVGYQLARALEAPLEALVVRKLGAPGNPEFGFGAVAPGGVRYLDAETVRMLGLSPEAVEDITHAEMEELERRERLYRGGRPAPELAGRTVILADDGLATGVTARAAILFVRRARPRQLVLAVPVAPVDTAEALRKEVDLLVCPMLRPDFRSIGQWYEDFGQVTDHQVLERLQSNEQLLAARQNV